MSTDSKFTHGDLVIVLSHSPGEATMSWHGSSDARNPAEFLEPIFRHVVAVSRGRRRTVTVDLTKLEYMNSSTVSPIINLLKTLNAEGIKSRVVFSDAEWQQVHMRCMRTITRVLANVEVEGSPRLPGQASG